ncbi:hypothetical protein QQF64_019324 [Cirrhinus molitorella]|uniref:Uncharacterized protein n=1 Tax=Cirrhinus molitorella TaxID=172907 RepID=A0ABR3LFA5_9TELE
MQIRIFTSPRHKRKEKDTAAARLARSKRDARIFMNSDRAIPASFVALIVPTSQKEMKRRMLPTVTWANASNLCANTHGKVMARSRIILMDRLAVWMTACVFVCARVVVPTCSCHCRHLRYCHIERGSLDWMVYSDPLGESGQAHLTSRYRVGLGTGFGGGRMGGGGRSVLHIHVTTLTLFQKRCSASAPERPSRLSVKRVQLSLTDATVSEGDAERVREPWLGDPTRALVTGVMGLLLPPVRLSVRPAASRGPRVLRSLRFQPSPENSTAGGDFRSCF